MGCAQRQCIIEKNYTLCFNGIFSYQITVKVNSETKDFPLLLMRQLVIFHRNVAIFNWTDLRAQEELEARTRCKMKLKVHIF